MDQSFASAEGPPSFEISVNAPRSELLRARLRHALPVAIAVFSTCLICIGLFREFASGPEESPSSALATQALSASPPNVDYDPIPRVEATALALESSTPEDPAASPPGSLRGASFKRSAQASRFVGAWLGAPRAAVSSSNRDNPQNQGSVSAAPASAAAGAKVDAWDPSTFGGRH